ncbi:bifunctional protein-disulfide isomerase/oxidoreductase DsbC [Bowmanella yangjiangensis]|uniref:Thiol:disulfide interchange protein n=1 Tax=Bowmanella yangjiangensis TaxID=2811230 RepID=A0ABS3CMM6_9ALTE|nr:bifunctional protein-disulfide isomerase/oxidoreductase DsbC [Bowmanella yangjiangensis]MBN7818362.1 bifunctional protein-disulfide isomerase/oxidoreductase DsbC [Bowmanella yangjiangensis]
MMRIAKLIMTSALLGSLAFGVQAKEDYSAVKAKLVENLGLAVSSIEPSPVPGLLQALTSRGLFYISQDGKYLVHGRVFNLNNEMINETEMTLGVVRAAGVKKFDDSMVEFKAKDEKYKVTVFTDTTCGYCRKLHSQIDDYNDLGITVRYLAFPRGGVNSEGYKDLLSVWCADDPKKAMTEAKAGKNIASKTCASKVSEQYDFGQQIGINGTPAIILEDGTLIPGYQPPTSLKAVLDEHNS